MRESTLLSRRAFLKEAVAGAAVAATGPVLLASAAAPAKVDYPAKGKVVNLIVPWPPGGPADVSARLLAQVMERDLGTPIPILNKGGAATQIGMTELARSKPDGYTFGQVSLPTFITVYLNPERKAVFTRKDFQPVALYLDDPGAIAVRADSPYKTLSDLVEAAKANPWKIRCGSSGILGQGHLEGIELEKVSGARFAKVNFEGGAAALTALLGGSSDFYPGVVSDFAVRHKSGDVRVLAVYDKEESPFLPGVKTAEAQGYKVAPVGSSRGWAVPAGTPKEIIDVLSQATKKGTEDDQFKARTKELGMMVRYLGTDEYASYWTSMEAHIVPLLEQAGVKVPK